MVEFFISYNGKDKQWAEWIAWQLEAAGYTTVIQAWDFRPGGNFVLDMQQAAQAERTIAVLSPHYLEALYTQPEWAAAFALDPTGAKKTLLPVRVADCQLKGLLSQIVYIDLVGKSEKEAQAAMLAGLNTGRAKPSTSPSFPQSALNAPPSQSPPPPFPPAADPTSTGSSSQVGGVHFSGISGSTLNVGNISANVSARGDIVGGSKRVVNTSGGAYIEGAVNTGGGDFVGRDKITTGASPEAVTAAFAGLYQVLETKPDSLQKKLAQQAVETLEQEARKGPQAEEKRVQEGFEVILAMLPDIAEVAVQTFINPIQGISVTFQKIARKAQEKLQGSK